jgi:hypothetical protein
MKYNSKSIHKKMSSEKQLAKTDLRARGLILIMFALCVLTGCQSDRDSKKQYVESVFKVSLPLNTHVVDYRTVELSSARTVYIKLELGETEYRELVRNLKMDALPGGRIKSGAQLVNESRWDMYPTKHDPTPPKWWDPRRVDVRLLSVHAREDNPDRLYAKYGLGFAYFLVEDYY